MTKTPEAIELRHWLWIGISTLAVIALTVAAIQFTRESIAFLILVVSIALATLAAKDRALGVGVLGAIASVVLISPTGLGLPFFTGIAVGSMWLLGCVIVARRRIQLNTVFALFAIPTVIGILCSLILPEIPILAVLVAVFTLLVGLVAGSTLSNGEKRIIRVGIVILACLEAAILIYETFVLKGWLFGDPTRWAHPFFEGSYRAAGTVGHPIAAGTILLVAIGLASASYWKKRVGKVLVLVLLFIGVFATGSMSVYITSIVALLLPYAANRSLFAHVIKVALAVLVLVHLTTNQLLTEQVIGGIGDLNSAHRLNTLLGIPNLVFNRTLRESLFGTGWGSAAQNYAAGHFIDDSFFAPDNQFVTVLMATGVVGMFLFLIFLAQIWQRRSQQSWVAIVVVVMMFLSFDLLGWAATASIFIVIVLDLRPNNVVTFTAVGSATGLTDV